MNATWGEPPHELQIQAQAVLAVYGALGGATIFGTEGTPAVVMDDIASVRRTHRHIDPDGKRYLYTTNVTVSVSKVELPGGTPF